MESILKEYFGFSGFRPYQKEVAEKVLEGKDCLVVMATGSGKSLCYQIPPLVAKKTAIVVSPLLSLMQDQVMSLRQRGIRAEYLGSSQINQSASFNAEKGVFDILYMTPEKACSLPKRFWTNLLAIGISLLAVDEAHCISEWGHNFRKEYKQLHILRDYLPDVPCVALTATATEKVRIDIISSLAMYQPYIAIGSFDRPNLFYGVRHCNHSLSSMNELVKEVANINCKSSSTIIYCSTIKDTEQMYELLSNAGIRACIYHGKMDNKAREASHRSFITDEVFVMVATIAFGMGIDKPDIRCVIHFGCPKSLESYYQESGRCGRDGLPSTCWLYYSRSDFTKADFYCSEATNEIQKKAIMDSFMAMQRYCFVGKCRRKFLLEYFGEFTSDDCGNCDNCTGSKDERDLSRESFLLISCVKSCGGRWGLNMPIDILRGSRAKKIVDNKFDELPLHGLGKDHSPNWWKALGSLLISNGYLKETIRDTFRFVSVSPLGAKFLSTANTPNHKPLVLAMISEMLEEDHGGSINKVGDAKSSASETAEFSDGELKLYHVLLDVRMKLAKDNRTAPYAICGDQTIRKITKIRPSTRARLANIDGVNQHFATNYGDTFLHTISQLSQEQNLPLDYSASVNTDIRQESSITNKPLTQVKPGGAKAEAWRLWQIDGLSLQNIANHPGRAAPIKEQTVLSYILDAACEGCEVSWQRFCREIGLSFETCSLVRKAIAKVGWKDKLKPIKEELPENVTYDMIKTVLTMEEVGVSAESVFLSKPSKEEPDTSQLASCQDDELVDENASAVDSIVAEADVSPHSVKRSHGASAGSPTKKMQRMCEMVESCPGKPEATEEAVLELVTSHDGISLDDIVERFNRSGRESINQLLDSLEGDFSVYKKNGLYRAL